MKTTFTTSEDQFIKDNYLTMPIKTMARALGRSGCGVRGRMNHFNLVVPKEIAEQRRKASYFTKGQVSWNKGLKQTEYMSAEAIERTKKTRFKKGNKPHNTNYEKDAIVTRADKSGRLYQYIKIRDGYWRLHHRVLWEKEHGPIPDDSVIAFKDGNPENVTIENLECITKAENAIRNKGAFEQLPEELKTIVKLKNKLKKTIRNERKSLKSA